MPNNYAKMVGEQLRKVRLQKGLSLQEVEAKSRKRFKASIVGAYERGERNVSVPRLYEMARFYDAPVDFFLVEKEKKSKGTWTPRGQIQINLEALQSLSKREKGPLLEYLELIRFQRGDFNEKVISIREEDLRAIACLYHTTPATLSDKWSEQGLIAA